MNKYVQMIYNVIGSRIRGYSYQQGNLLSGSLEATSRRQKINFKRRFQIDLMEKIHGEKGKVSTNYFRQIKFMVDT